MKRKLFQSINLLLISFSLSGCLGTKETFLQPALMGFWGVYFSVLIAQCIRRAKIKPYQIILGAASIVVSVITPVLMPVGGLVVYEPEITGGSFVSAVKNWIEILLVIGLVGILFGIMATPCALTLAKTKLVAQGKGDGFLRLLATVVFLYIIVFILPPILGHWKTNN